MRKAMLFGVLAVICIGSEATADRLPEIMIALSAGGASELAEQYFKDRTCSTLPRAPSNIFERSNDPLGGVPIRTAVESLARLHQVPANVLLAFPAIAELRDRHLILCFADVVAIELEPRLLYGEEIEQVLCDADVHGDVCERLISTAREIYRQHYGNDG